MNKAQEALDRIVENSCPKRTNCKSCDISYRCNALMKDEVDKIQHSIDCQLTVEEISTIAKALERLEMYCDLYLADKKQMLDRIKAIRGKLEKQKEL